MEEHIEVQTQAQAAAAASSAQDFDALLREKDFQSEFDRRVSRALEAARGRWAQETERKLEQARAEAEAMARMSGEERMAHDYARREAELQAREAEIGRRELRAEAARLLQERALPAELMDALNYDSAEGVARSVDAAERAFREAVQLAALVNAEKAGSSQALREGAIGRVYGMDNYMSQAVRQHATGIEI